MSSTLIIFDCDGVLVDSEMLGYVVFSDLLAKYGYRMASDEMANRFKGIKLAACLEILERETSIKLPDSFVPDLRQRMSATFREHLEPVDGALRLVESLRVPFCVASNGPTMKIEENLRTAKLYPHFKGKIFSSYDVESWKPDPGLFLHAAKFFGVPPGNCVVVEDSVFGVTAGIAAGMQVFALNAHGDGESLSAAHLEFESLQEIHAHFASLGWAISADIS